jgi:hypothetical protein
MKALEQAERVVIIGSGFIGLEKVIVSGEPAGTDSLPGSGWKLKRRGVELK